MTSPSTEPIPAPIRLRLEELLGADLGEVRVVLDPSVPGPAHTEGHRIHVRPDAWDPDRPDGLEVLGHEVAHVLQQRHGRVRPTSVRGGVPVNDDPDLEREAIAAARDLVRGRPVRIPGTPAGDPPPVRQHYETVAPAGRAARGLAVENPGLPPAATLERSSFVHQDKTAGPGGVPGPSFLSPGAQTVNLLCTDPAAADLRVSAGGRIAVQDADLATRQPKVFYATRDVVAESNARLALLGSEFELRTDDDGADQRRIRIGANTLYRVTPRNTTGGSTGVRATTTENCDSLVGNVTGTSTQYLVPGFSRPLAYPAGPDWAYHVARQLLPAPLPPAVDVSTPLTWARTMATIADRYSALARDPSPGFRDQLRTFGINQFAAPSVGEAFVTSSLMAIPDGAGFGPGHPVPTYSDHYHRDAGVSLVIRKELTWGSHWAGVVAQDGPDVVTLENYARNAEDRMDDSISRFYFQMYDTAAAARSWHTQWTGTPMQATVGPAVAAPFRSGTHVPVAAGVRSFANPITLRMVPSGTRLDTIATAVHPDVDAVKDGQSRVAAAATADEEARAVLRAVRYAAAHLGVPPQTGKGSRIDGWLDALRTASAAARFPANRWMIEYALDRVGRIARG